MPSDSKGFDSYLTVKAPKGPIEFKEKNSRFLSFIYPIQSMEDIQKRLKSLRKSYHNATHICYAFRLGQGSEASFRYNDDGEPGNSAGLPIYNVIKNAGYLNVLIAVVRYFGGIKLGTRGLARAYSYSARLAVEASDAVKKSVMEEISFFYPYDLTGDVMQTIKDSSLEVISQVYKENGTQMRVKVPASKREDMVKILLDRSSGRVSFRSNH